MNVFITGAEGFLGSNLSLFLASKGFNVFSGVKEKNNSFIQKQLKENSTIIECNVLAKKKLSNLFQGIDFCFHFASQSNVLKAESMQEKTFDININGSINVFNACNENKVIALFFPSSVLVYGEPKNILNKKIKETSNLKPANFYAQTKLEAEKVLEMLAKEKKTKLLIARLSNVFGFNDLNFSRLIPATIKSFLEAKPKEVQLDYRDFIFFENINEFFFNCIKFIDSASEQFFVFNAVSEKMISTKKIFSLIASNFNLTIPLKAIEEKEFNVFSAEKAKKMLSWDNSFNLNECLKKTIEWYKNNWFLIEK